MRLRAPGTQLTCEDRAEGEDPPPDALVRDGDAALGQQVLDIAEAQFEAQIHPDRALDDFALEAVVGLGLTRFEPGQSQGSERLTGALLDRLTHHVTILAMNGDSYRLKQSAGRRRTTIRAEQNQATPETADPDTGEITID